MALRERLGILLGLKVLAAATVAAVILSGAPAKADGGVRIVLGFPASVGIVFGLPNRGHYNRDYRRDTRRGDHYRHDHRRDRRVVHRQRHRNDRHDRWSRHDRRYDRGRDYDRRSDRRRHRRGPTHHGDRHHP